MWTNAVWLFIMLLAVALIFTAGLLDVNMVFKTVINVAHPLWAFIVCLIIISCHYGDGGIFGWLLSQYFWIPLDRIGLSFYLTHTYSLVYRVAARRTPVEMDLLTLVRTVISVAEKSHFPLPVLRVLLRSRYRSFGRNLLSLGCRKTIHGDGNAACAQAKSCERIQVVEPLSSNINDLCESKNQTMKQFK